MMAISPTILESPLLRHFVRLARQGKCRGCSTSEEACRRLADLIVARVPYFDDSAIDGLLEFIELAKAAPNTAEDLVR